MEKEVLYNHSIDILDLSVRSKNALKAYEICNLGSFLKLRTKELIMIPNLGAKSIREIENCITNIESAIAHTDIENALRKELGEVPLSNEDIFKINREKRNIATLLESLLDGKYKKRKEVLIARLFDGLTLAECGKKIGVSRERIRQIEAKFLTALKNKLISTSIDGETYQKEITEYLIQNKKIIRFFDLDKVGSTYNGISKYLIGSKNPKIFLGFLFAEDKICRWEIIDNKYQFFLVDDYSVEELVRSKEFKNYLSSSKSSNLYELVKTYCLIKNQP